MVVEFINIVYLDDAAHNEMLHLDINCMPSNFLKILNTLMLLPYFFGYKIEFFSFQNNPKDLDPSYKMDLDLWDRLGRVKLVL